MDKIAQTVCSFAFACLLAVPAAAQSHPPVEAFGSLPFTVRPSLSYDGRYMAAIQSAAGRAVGTVYDLDQGGNPMLFPTGEWFLNDMQWTPGNRLILIVKRNAKFPHGSEMITWWRTMAVDPDGKNPVSLMRKLPDYGFNTSTAGITDLNLGNPGHVLVSLFNSHYRGASLDLMTVDLKTGDADRVMAGKGENLLGTISWITDGYGRVVGRIDRSYRPLREHVMLYRDGEWSEAGVYDASADKDSGIAGLSEDGKALLRFTRDSRSMQVVESFDLATHTSTPLFAAPANDVDGLIFDPWTGRAVGATYTDERPQHRFFSPERQATQRGVEKVFPGLDVAIVSENAARDRVLLAVEGPQAPPSYYFLNRTTHQAKLIASSYPGLTPADLGEMKPYNYKARDGLDIPAYITLPPGKAPKNLPAVVMPHGGPDARDAIGFDWWAQFLANRGYVVLQPNFRGSAGYGHKFTEAGLKQWGLKMQDDISDGVKKMVADGIVDPKRICIVGASYGGYAALAGATFTPDLYACAVSWAGISDLQQLLSDEVQFPDAPSVSFWKSRIGDFFRDEDKLRAASPAFHAAEVKCPVLLLHGESDNTVDIYQSQIEEKALKAAHKQVSFIRFAGGEDHYMNTAETRIRLLKETEAFLAKYIGMTGSPAASP
jgi:dipeptidyl aminopeptidase/acylaminoacyl peptidase